MINLFVDDIRTPPDSSKTWTIARTYKDALVSILTQEIDTISLDHDLGEGKTGYDLVLEMVKSGNFPKHIQIHSANPVGVENMSKTLCRYAPLESLDSDILRFVNHVNRRTPN
jgi:hypothetical protein